jgi:hypothetical protein
LNQDVCSVVSKMGSIDEIVFVQRNNVLIAKEVAVAGIELINEPIKVFKD